MSRYTNFSVRGGILGEVLKLREFFLIFRWGSFLSIVTVYRSGKDTRAVRFGGKFSEIALSLKYFSLVVKKQVSNDKGGILRHI